MRRRGFTLVELLVVVAIISLLLTTLLPGLQSARDHARSIFCVNNLRQFALASATYADTYHGSYPFALSVVRRDDETINACWDFTTIHDKATNEDRIEGGMLWQGVAPDEIHQCPSFEGNSNTKADPYTGYNYNYSYIGGTALTIIREGRNPIRKVTPSAQIDHVTWPAQTALFGDGQWEGGANKYMRAPWPGDLDGGVGGREAGTQGYRHQGKTNVAYCDGHAASTDKCYTVSEPGVTAAVTPGTGFLSPDNTAYALMDVARYHPPAEGGGEDE